MEKHFVKFMSPGSFVSEETSKPIDSWDIGEATKMAHDIVERYNATPYGFQFITKGREPEDLDSKITARSRIYFLGGTILTLEDIKSRNDSGDRILISNMEINGYARVVENNNSWKSSHVFGDDDVLLDFEVLAHQEGS